MKRMIFTAFFAFILLAATAGTVSCQSQKPATFEEQKAALVEILKADKHTQYDNDLTLANLLGASPLDVTNAQRAVLVEGFIINSQGRLQQVSSRIALAWIYDKEYVVAPIQLFFSPDYGYGPTPLWKLPGVTLKVYLLPDLRVDDGWQKEELSGTDIKFNDDLTLAVVKRVEPMIGLGANYSMGKYEDLSVGNALYMTSQNNGRITVMYSSVSEKFTYIKNLNLFSGSGAVTFDELGGLTFALRDGKPELVGFLSVMEQVQSSDTTVYVYYVDVQQIQNFIKTISPK